MTNTKQTVAADRGCEAVRIRSMPTGTMLICQGREGDASEQILELSPYQVAQLRAMPAAAPGAAADDPQAFLRHLVDLVWKEATESEAVPSTAWADRLIAKAQAATPAQLESRKNSRTDDPIQARLLKRLADIDAAHNLSTPWVAGSNPAGIAPPSDAKSPINKGFSDIEPAPPYSGLLERKGIETDENGSKSRKNPEQIPELISHSETKTPLVCHRAPPRPTWRRRLVIATIATATAFLAALAWVQP